MRRANIRPRYGLEISIYICEALEEVSSNLIQELNALLRKQKSIHSKRYAMKTKVIWSFPTCPLTIQLRLSTIDSLFLTLLIKGLQFAFLILEMIRRRPKYLNGRLPFWKCRTEVITFVSWLSHFVKKINLVWQLTLKHAHSLKSRRNCLVLPGTEWKASIKIITSSVKRRFEMDSISLQKGVGIRPFVAHSWREKNFIIYKKDRERERTTLP